jgi:hypothetical protein
LGTESAPEGVNTRIALRQHILEIGRVTTYGQHDQGQAISGSWQFDHTWST